MTGHTMPAHRADRRRGTGRHAHRANGGRRGAAIGRAATTGTGRMARINWRTGRVGLVLGPLAAAGLVDAVMSSIADLYPTAQQRASYAATLGQSPATAAFNGRPYDLDHVGGIAVYEVGFFGLLILPAIAILLAVRHSRGQEDLGRADLVTSMRIGRLAPLLAAMALITAVLVAAGLLLLPGVLMAGFEVAGSVRYALVLVAYMLVAMGLGFVAAEVSQASRSAYGVAFGVLGAMYLVRAVIDGRKWDLGWLTPMGWLAEARPFADSPPWWPTIALLTASLALCGAAITVRARRDLGAGVIAPRPGPAVGAVRGPLRLVWRVSRGSAVSWAVGALAWGFAAGLLAEEMRQLLIRNPALTEVLLGNSETPDSIMTYIAAVMIGLMGAAVALQGVARLAAEESSGRIGVVLSTPLGRPRWWVAATLVIVAQVVVTLAVGGAGFGVGAALTGSQAVSLTEGMTAALSYAAPALLIGAIAFLLLALSPRLAALGWLVLLWATLVALLADTLQLPRWARNLSPLELLGDVPIVEVDATTWLVMLGSAVAAVLVALPLLSRRDIAAG